MGKPTKNAFNGGGRPTDMSKSPLADVRPRGGMTPEGYQAMKAEKRQKFVERQRAKNSGKKPRKKS